MAKQTVSYSKLAAALLPLVGGAENVRAVTHCMTRLRLELADESRADTDAIKALDGVSAVVQQSGQYQIVIGPAVNEVFNAFLPLVSTTDASGVPAAPVKKNWKYYGNKVLDYITSSITPLIGVLVGAGLIEALASILVTFGALDAASSTYTVLYQIGYTGLYFLPVLVGYNAANKLKVPPFLGAFLGAILIMPSLMNVEGLSLFGLALPVKNYGASVFPILISIPVLKLVDMALMRILPKALELPLRNSLDVLITAPIMLLVTAPCGGLVGDGLAAMVTAIMEVSPSLAVAVLSFLWPLMITLGIHTAFIPIGYSLLGTLGYDTLIGPASLPTAFAVPAAALSVAFFTKDAKMRSTAFSAGLTSLVAAAEPSLYAVLVPLKRPLFACALSCGITGFVEGMLHVTRYTPGPAGLGTLAIFVKEPSDLVRVIAVGILAFVLSFVLTRLFGFENMRSGLKK